MTRKHYTKPVKGCAIYATEAHSSINAGDLVGYVIKVEGNIVVFKDWTGKTDSLIWRFNDGLNKFHTFGA